MTDTKQLSIIQPITADESKLIELRDSYANLVVTKETIKAVDAARKTLKQARLEIEKTVDANKKAVRELLKKHEDEGERLVGIIKPIEARLQKEQKEFEEREAEELRLKLKAEEDRKRGIKARIYEIEALTGQVRGGGLDGNLDDVACPHQKDTFEEYNEEGNGVIEAFEMALKSRKIYVEEQALLKAAEERIKQEKEKAELLKSMEDEKPAPKEPTPREKQLIELGFEDSGFAWTHPSGSRIPYAMMDVADDIFDTLILPIQSKLVPELDKISKEFSEAIDKAATEPIGMPETNHNLGNNTALKVGKPDFKSMVSKEPKTAKPIIDNVSVSTTPDLNIFEVNGYKVGIGKSIPFSKVLAVKNAIIEALK